MIRRLVFAFLTIQAVLLEMHFGLGHGLAPMATIMLDGFDYYASGDAVTRGWSGAPSSMPAGRIGGQGFGLSALSRTRPLPAAKTTVIMGVAFTASGATNGNDIFALSVAGTNTVRVFTNGGKLAIRNAGGTVIATGTTTIITGTWYYVEIKAVINGASGTAELHLNGAAEIASTTANFGSTGVDGVYLNSGGWHDLVFDDLIVLDNTGTVNNDFLGDGRVVLLSATADGAHTDWTPTGGGSHYTQINDATPNGDTSYVSDATPGHIDTYTFSDVDSGATVFAVQKNLYARKDDTNTRQIAPVTRESGSDSVGATVTLSTSYLFYSQIDDKDPAAAAWTAAAVNGCEFGVKTVA